MNKRWNEFYLMGHSFLFHLCSGTGLLFLPWHICDQRTVAYVFALASFVIKGLGFLVLTGSRQDN
jgi:hypothetical protein